MAHLDGIIETDDDSSGSLTFGIELEFMVPALRPGQVDTDPLDSRPLFRTEDHDPVDYGDRLNDFILPTLQEAPGITVREEMMDKHVPPHDNVPRYNVWRLINDTSVQPGDDPRYKVYEWVGKEVTSEVFRVDDRDHSKKITDMCRAIRNCRVHLNASTGVHVHVGRGDDGFTMMTLKRIATLIWLLDKQLLALHHPSRFNNKHCQPLQKMSKLAARVALGDHGKLNTLYVHAKEMEEHTGQDIPSDGLLNELCQIWATEEPEELARLMGNTNDPHARNPMRSAIRGTVGFRRFLPAGKTGGNINTVEFRQMAGSLDPEHIIQWIEVCTALVEFARIATPAKFRGVVRKAMHPLPPYTAVNLLIDIGLSEAIAFWTLKVTAYATGQHQALELYEGSEHDLFVPSM